MDRILNNSVHDGVFLDFILEFTRSTPTVKFRKWEGRVSLEKVVKGNEIAHKEPYVFLTERRLMDPEAQDFVYNCSVQMKSNLARKRSWNVAMIGYKFCILNTDATAHVERPLQFREFLVVLKMITDPNYVRDERQNECLLCSKRNLLFYGCIRCDALYCASCIREIKRESDKIFHCCICDQDMEIEEEPNSRLIVKVNTRNILLLKEGALLFLLQHVEGIQFGPRVTHPVFDRAVFLEEIAVKVPISTLRKYLDIHRP